MKVKILKKNDKIVLDIAGIDVAFANALRRVLISEIPILAIEDVDFSANDSVLYDELVAHRLGLIPLKFDPTKFVLPEKCKCKGKGCPTCQVSFTLDEVGPKIVLSSDLKTNSDVKPLYPNIPITSLREGAELKLQAKAILGLGKGHSKWQAAVVGYKNYPTIRVTAKCNGCGKCIQICPMRIFSREGKRVSVKDAINCSFCDHCTEVCAPGAIQLIRDEHRFIFQIESISGLKPEQIVEIGATVLQEKGKEIISLLK